MPTTKLVGIATALLLSGYASSSATAQATPPIKSLPGLLAQASRADCASRDEPRARAVWESLRRRFADADSLSVWASGLSNSAGWATERGFLRFDSAASNLPDGTTSGWNTRVVRRDALQNVIKFSIAPRVGSGSRGMSGSYRQQLSREIAAIGYARLLPGVNADLTQTRAAWAYPPLDAELATHFISDEFGRRTAFSLVAPGEPVTLAFCSRSQYRSKPYISGVLVLRADTTLERAYWSFHTPAPDEHAGGEAEFAAYDSANGLPLLLPARGTYWRRHGVALFYQRQQSYPAWASGLRDALPQGLVSAEPERNDVKPIVIFRTVIDSTGTH